MKRYIDAEDLKAVIKANDWTNRAVPVVVNWIIDRSPAADVVEVVRCKDCRFRFDGCCLEPRNRIVFRVPDFGNHYGCVERIMVDEDHFCSYGERKSEK